MKHIITLILIAFVVNQTFATHNLAGHITYKNVGITDFEFEIVLYSEASNISPDREEIGINYGQTSDIDTIPRYSVDTISYGGHLIKKNIYRATYRYTIPGDYNITISDPSRALSFSNFVNGVEDIFYIRSLVSVDFNEINNSVRFDADQFFVKQIGSSFDYSFGIYDPDGDQLFYRLANPLGEDGIEISGFTIPNGLTIDSGTGELTWDNPSQVGYYLISIVIDECRGNKLVGKVRIDVVIEIQGNMGYAPVFNKLGSWPRDTDSNYYVSLNPGNNIQLPIVYEDSGAALVDLSAYGFPFSSTSPATFTSIISGNNKKEFKFDWTPSMNELSCSPYMVTFRGISSGGAFNVASDVTLLIEVTNGSLTCDSCTYPIGIQKIIKESDFNVTFSPNPVKESSLIMITSSYSLVELVTIEIYDLHGRLQISLECSTNENCILERNNLASGVYFWKTSNQGNNYKDGMVIFK